MSASFNTTRAAFDMMVSAACSYSEAAEFIRAARAAGTLEKPAAREEAIAALIAKKPAYAAQLVDGKPAQSSALQKAVTRMLRDTDPEQAAKAEQAEPAAELEIPADIMAAALKLVKLCAEYEGAAKLAATAVAQARAGLKG